jgi:hypothetical protein
MFETIAMQNVSHILGMGGCGSSKEMKGLVTKRVPAGTKVLGMIGDSLRHLGNGYSSVRMELLISEKSRATRYPM